MPSIPVTYKCWGCKSETTVMEKCDLPIPSKTIWNLCRECRKRKEGIKVEEPF